jgi:DNA topoisomerase I
LCDVNQYLCGISGEDITAKDFRTWAGTQLAAMALQELAAVDGQTAAKSAIVRAVEPVAKHLGNTTAVCRNCAIHPAIFEGYLDSMLVRVLAQRTRAYLACNIAGMSAEVAAVGAFLRLRLKRMAEGESARRGDPRTAREGADRQKGGAETPAGARRERPRSRERRLSAAAPTISAPRRWRMWAAADP